VELWELVARESIRDLVARYNANADAGRFEEVAALFARDAVMELVAPDGGTRRFEGPAGVVSLLAGTKATWDRARGGGGSGRGGGHDPGDAGSASRGGDTSRGGGGRHHVRHVVATHQIDVVDRDHARGRSYYLVLMRHGLDHWGRYVDDYGTRDGTWLITRRRVLADGRARDATAGPATGPTGAGGAAGSGGDAAGG
jgi:hypothetical protein